MLNWLKPFQKKKKKSKEIGHSTSSITSGFDLEHCSGNQRTATGKNKFSIFAFQSTNMKKFRLPRNYINLLLLFLIINTVCLLYRNGSIHLNFFVDVYVIVIANLILFLLALLGSYRHGKAMDNKNPNVFIRSIMGMTVLKFFVLVTAALIYVFTAKENRNVPAIIISLVLYILYAIMEVSAAYRMNKDKSKSS